MTASGYYGERAITGNLTPRWMRRLSFTCLFLYIVYELLVGLSNAMNAESDPAYYRM